MNTSGKLDVPEKDSALNNDVRWSSERPFDETSTPSLEHKLKLGVLTPEAEALARAELERRAAQDVRKTVDVRDVVDASDIADAGGLDFAAA